MPQTKRQFEDNESDAPAIDMQPHSETHEDFIHRCLSDATSKAQFPDDDVRLEQCQECWRQNSDGDAEDDDDAPASEDENKRENKMRVVRLRQFSTEQPDMDKIREVAGNPDLKEADVFHFRTFQIAKSGPNKNGISILKGALIGAALAWVGKQILYRDHKRTTDNQIGRIYEAWTEDGPDGETVLYGRGYGVRTDDLKDIYTRIENGVHRELSCGYQPLLSQCKKCQTEYREQSACPNGCRSMQIDKELQPDHVSFVSQPAIDGSGTVFAAQRKQIREFQRQIKTLKIEADDGREFRAFVTREFSKWYGLTNRDASQKDIDVLANKLSAREMMTLAKISKDRWSEIMPTGRQLSKPEPHSDNPPVGQDKHMSLKEIHEAVRNYKEQK